MVHTTNGRGHFAAAAIALVAWSGLAVQFGASMNLAGSPITAAWIMLRYFTIITNLILAVVFTGLAAGRPGSNAPSLLGGITLAILLVGIVYGLLLRNLVELSGGAKLADLLLHHATPVATPLFWWAYAPHGALRPRDPWVWALCPLVYLVYALIRGSIDGVYAYPFIDAAQIGWTRTALNAGAIALCFILAGYGLVWSDGWLGRGTKPA